MEIISLMSEEKRRSFADIFEIGGKIRSITIISAYIDTNLLDEILELLKAKIYARGKSELKIFIDESSSRFFSDKNTKKNLDELQIKISEIFSKESGVFLVKFGKLFHSKMYVIEGNIGKAGKVVLGSLNFTKKGINENEEIILIGKFFVGEKRAANKLANWAKSYVASLSLPDKSIRVDNVTKAGNFASCMRDFLLDGRIYDELKEQNPFRFKLHLPDFVKTTDGIDDMLDTEVNDTISLEKLIGSESGLRKKLPAIDKCKISWKKYCISTCYGYWNPRRLFGNLATELNKKKKGREPYFKSIIDIIMNDGAEIEKAFLELCARIGQHLIVERDRLGLTENDESKWKYEVPEHARQSWTSWYTKLISKLKNEKFLERVILDMRSVPSPDVWNDSLSSQEFEESFFDSVLYLWSKEFSKETTNKIAQSLATNLAYDKDQKSEIDAGRLRADIEQWMLVNQKNSILESHEEE